MWPSAKINHKTQIKIVIWAFYVLIHYSDAHFEVRMVQVLSKIGLHMCLGVSHSEYDDGISSFCVVQAHSKVINMAVCASNVDVISGLWLYDRFLIWNFCLAWTSQVMNEQMSSVMTAGEKNSVNNHGKTWRMEKHWNWSEMGCDSSRQGSAQYLYHRRISLKLFSLAMIYGPFSMKFSGGCALYLYSFPFRWKDQLDQMSWMMD